MASKDFFINNDPKSLALDRNGNNAIESDADSEEIIFIAPYRHSRFLPNTILHDDHATDSDSTITSTERDHTSLSVTYERELPIGCISGLIKNMGSCLKDNHDEVDRSTMGKVNNTIIKKNLEFGCDALNLNKTDGSLRPCRSYDAMGNLLLKSSNVMTNSGLIEPCSDTLRQHMKDISRSLDNLVTIETSTNKANQVTEVTSMFAESHDPKSSESMSNLSNDYRITGGHNTVTIKQEGSQLEVYHDWGVALKSCGSNSPVLAIVDGTTSTINTDSVKTCCGNAVSKCGTIVDSAGTCRTDDLELLTGHSHAICAHFVKSSQDVQSNTTLKNDCVKVKVKTGKTDGGQNNQNIPVQSLDIITLVGAAGSKSQVNDPAYPCDPLNSPKCADDLAQNSKTKVDITCEHDGARSVKSTQRSRAQQFNSCRDKELYTTQWVMNADPDGINTNHTEKIAGQSSQVGNGSADAAVASDTCAGDRVSLEDTPKCADSSLTVPALSSFPEADIHVASSLLSTSDSNASTTSTALSSTSTSSSATSESSDNSLILKPAAGRNTQKKSGMYSFEDIVQVLQDKIQALLKCQDFTGSNVRADLKFIRRTTRYSPDLLLNQRIVDRLVHLGIAHVFLNVWRSVTQTDFMNFTKELSSPYKNLQISLSIVWNCTDKSATLCETLLKSSFPLALIEQLATDRLQSADLKHAENQYVLKAYLGILHNIVQHCSDSRKTLRGVNAVQALRWYLTSTNDIIRTKAYLILAYIVDEEENDIINASCEHLQFLAGILKDGLDSENHFNKQYAFWAKELVCGINHLAMNDNNKRRLGEAGALELYIKLLENCTEDEESVASAGIWVMVFCDPNKKRLKEIPGAEKVLQRLSVHGRSTGSRRAARAVLWLIASLQEQQQAVEGDADVPHIMISYHHRTSQATMVKVTRYLRQVGYKVWMDVDDMHGSTLEAMALAIEKSCILLVCMTQGYKDSPSCRTEAEYAYRLKKEVIPLLLQEAYDPDGWLGAFVGSRLHFDFSHEEMFIMEMQKLIHELGDRGKVIKLEVVDCGKVRRTSQRMDLHVCVPESTSCVVSGPTSSSSLHSYGTYRSGVNVWGQAEVRQWLQRNDLGFIADRFPLSTGDLLLQLKKMCKTAPEYYYRTLEHQLHFDLVTTLSFTKALDELQ